MKPRRSSTSDFLSSFHAAMIMFVVCAILAFIRGYQAYYIALTMTFVFGESYTQKVNFCVVSLSPKQVEINQQRS